MGLAVRMMLYAFFAGLASLGLIEFDHATGDVAFNIYSFQLAAVGAGGYILTFITSRFAKVK